MHDPSKRHLSPRTQISGTGGERTPLRVGAICADVEFGSAGKGAPPHPIDRVRPQLTGRGEGATTGGGGAATTARRRWGRRMRAAGGERTRTVGLGVDARPSSFVLAVGDGRIWARDSFVLHDPDEEMGLLFGFHLSEIV